MAAPSAGCRRDHHRSDAHGAKLANRSLMPPLTMSLAHDAEHPVPVGDGERVPPGRRLADHGPSRARSSPPIDRTKRLDRVRRPFRILRPSRSTPLIRVCAVNGTKRAPRARMSRSLNPNLSLAARRCCALRRLVGRRQAGRRRQLPFRHARRQEGAAAGCQSDVPVLSRGAHPRHRRLHRRPDVAITWTVSIGPIPAMRWRTGSPIVVG